MNGVEEIRHLLHGGWVGCGRKHQLFGRGRLGYALFGAGLYSWSLFRGCRHFWRRLLVPGLFTGACQWSLLRGFKDLCRSTFGSGSRLGIGNTTPLEHVAPVISEAPLFRGRLRANGHRPNFPGECSASQ
jgi:hypothetical protein